MTRLPRLPMTLACSHYRYDGKSHGCAVLGTCEPIKAGPDLSACPEFHNPVLHCRKKVVDEFAEHCPCAGKTTPKKET